MNWQSQFADELSTEWVEQELPPDEPEENASGNGGTVINPTLLIREGTVKEEAQPQWKQPRQQKDMLSPLKLQTMFEPPRDSGHNISQMSDIIEETEESTLHESGKHNNNLDQDFTFSCPPDRNSWKAMPHFLGYSDNKEGSPLHSTPPQNSPLTASRKFGSQSARSEDVSSLETPSKPPNTDKTPRPLKLFQFNYDTFTRQHLESLVEEIDERAIPADDFVQPEWQDASLDAEEEGTQTDEMDERRSYRSAKRIRLSPETDFHHDFNLPMPIATPRSAVRDRIRERRAFTAIAANGTPLRPVQTAFSLPSTKTPRTYDPATPQTFQTAIRIAPSEQADPDPEETARQPVPEDPVPLPVTNPVASRLQQAQALMDRIRSHPLKSSTSSYDTSPSSASSSFSVEEPMLSPVREVTAEHFVDLDDEPFRPSSMPRITSHSPSRPRLASRNSNYMGSSGTAVGTVKSYESGTAKGTVSSGGTVRIQPSVASTVEPTSEIQPDSKQSSLESRGSSTNAQQRLAMQAEASLRKSLAQASALSKVGRPPGTDAGSRVVSTSSTASNPTKTHNYTTIPPEQVEQFIAQHSGSRMQFDPAQGKWLKTPKARMPLQQPPEEDRSSSEDDVFAGIESFIAPNADDGKYQLPEEEGNSEGEKFQEAAEEGDAEPDQSVAEAQLPKPQLDDLSDDQLSVLDMEEQHPMDLYQAAHYSSPQSKSPLPSPDLEAILPSELHNSPDFVPEPSRVEAGPNQSQSSNTSGAGQQCERPVKPPRRASLVGMGTPDVFGHKPLTRTNSRTKLDLQAKPSQPKLDLQPRSALKAKRSSSERLEKSRSVSVSFTDGKKSGRLLDDRAIQIPARGSSSLRYELLYPISHGDEDEEREDGEQSPSKGSFQAPDLLQDASLRSRKVAQAAESLGGARIPRVMPFSDHVQAMSPSLDISLRRPKQTMSHRSNGNATTLTECSFTVSHDALVKHLTDIEPFTPSWETITDIKLSSKGIDSLVRLKEFLPRLDAADLSDNKIEFLTGMPSCIRTLLLQQNRLTSLCSFSQLTRLERLDVSSNSLEDLSQLSALQHLRELKADHNPLTTISGIDKLDGLIKISLKACRLSQVDLTQARWHRVEYLNLSRNRIHLVSGIDTLRACISLNLDHNELESLTAEKQVTSMRVLRLCSNPISMFDVKPFPNVRTLFIDHAKLGHVKSLSKLGKLENLSLRGQDGKLALQSSSIAEVRRLYLSFNPLRTFPSHCTYSNLTYLELVSCSLSRLLPDSFSSTVPSLQVLNLSGNFLDDLTGLEGLRHLRRLKVTDNRISLVEPVVSCISRLARLTILDLRLNPLTLSYYSSHIQAEDWPAVDNLHKRTLPDHWFFKRISYRAVLQHACPTLNTIDGLPVEGEADAAKIRGLLVRAGKLVK